MPEYTLELEAELDLLEIGRYTVRTWSIEQAERYLGALKEHFEAISRNDAIETSVFEHRDDLRIPDTEMKDLTLKPMGWTRPSRSQRSRLRVARLLGELCGTGKIERTRRPRPRAGGQRLAATRLRPRTRSRGV